MPEKVSYNLTETILMFLWFFWWQKRSVPPLQLRRVSKTEDIGIQKLTLHYSYLPKWRNSKSCEILIISSTNVHCWLRYNQRKVLLFSLQTFLSQRNHTWRPLFWQPTAKETFHIFVACFLLIKIMLIYAKIQ